MPGGGRLAPIHPSKLCRKKSIKRDPPLLFQKAATSRTSRVCLYIVRGQVFLLYMRNNGHSFPPPPPLFISPPPPAPPTSEKEEEERREEISIGSAHCVIPPPPPLSPHANGGVGPAQTGGVMGHKFRSEAFVPKKKRRKKRRPIYRRGGLYCCLDENFSTKKCRRYSFQNQNSLDR